MRALVATGLVLILASSVAIGQIQLGGESGTAVRPRMPSTLRNLNERIEEVSFEEAPLDQVMEWLSGLTEMQVVVRWQTLEDAGIERDKPITMQVRNLRLSQVLWLLIREAGGSDLKLAYRASGNMLIISTEEDLGKEMVVRVYDVSDLLVRPQNFRGAPHLNLQNRQSTGQGGQGGGQSIFGGGSSGGGGGSNQDDDQNSGQGEDDDDIQELITLIIQTVEPDSWVDNGGLGTISAFRDLLVVRNNILVHQALGGYVEER